MTHSSAPVQHMSSPPSLSLSLSLVCAITLTEPVLRLVVKALVVSGRKGPRKEMGTTRLRLPAKCETKRRALPTIERSHTQSSNGVAADLVVIICSLDHGERVSRLIRFDISTCATFRTACITSCRESSPRMAGPTSLCQKVNPQAQGDLQAGT